jgi:hypothetical protein
MFRWMKETIDYCLTLTGIVTGATLALLVIASGSVKPRCWEEEEKEWIRPNSED